MKLSNLSFKKILREVRRLFQVKKNHFSPVPSPELSSVFQPSPVETIPWNGPTHAPLELTLQQRKMLDKLPGLEQGYQLGVLLEATKYIDFHNKTILEVGGSNLPRDLVFGVLGAKKWICVNLHGGGGGEDSAFVLGNVQKAASKNIYPLNHPDSKKIIQDNDYVIFDGSATKIGEELYNEFDACVSICAFEHIHDLAKAVDCIYHSLRTHGIFHTIFGPIWSCEVRHHFWVDDQCNFTRSRECHIPPFAHLLYSAPEIEKLLAPYYTTEEEKDTKDLIVKLCTDETVSNRLFYEDFLQIMKDSRFKNISVTSASCQGFVDEKTYHQLCAKYPGYSTFSVGTIQIVAQK